MALRGTASQYSGLTPSIGRGMHPDWIEVEQVQLKNRPANALPPIYKPMAVELENHGKFKPEFLKVVTPRVTNFRAGR